MSLYPNRAKLQIVYGGGGAAAKDLDGPGDACMAREAIETDSGEKFKLLVGVLGQVGLRLPNRASILGPGWSWHAINAAALVAVGLCDWGMVIAAIRAKSCS